jgi:superfamily II DNA/RNA helicase
MLRQPVVMDGKLRLIVVAPGRELASQITTVARDVVAGTGLTVQLAIGGTTFERNLEAIRKRKPDILVGTPGRIAQLVVGDGEQRRGRLSVQHVDTIVCDEFDALLEYQAHRDPTQALLSSLKRLKRDRLQSILCSATASDMLKEKKIANLEENYLRPDYVVTMAEDGDSLVTAGGKTTTRVSRTVMHGVIHVPHKRFALETLRRILHTDPLPQQILIFVSDARRVPIVVERLADRGIIAAPLHGDGDKTDRAEVSKALRDGYVGIVVSTELAARGLDAPLLTHVINMDLPTDSSHYAHRAGRCGRGGRPGVVINLTTSPQERKVPQRMAVELGIEMYTIDVKNSKLNVVDPASIELDPQDI